MYEIYFHALLTFSEMSQQQIMLSFRSYPKFYVKVLLNCFQICFILQKVNYLHNFRMVT